MPVWARIRTTCPEIGGHLLQKYQPRPMILCWKIYYGGQWRVCKKLLLFPILSIIKLMFRSILISHHIFILLQMPIASNLPSEFCLLVFFQTPLGPLRPIEKWR